jgi:hypothetical protein
MRQVLHMQQALLKPRRLQTADSHHRASNRKLKGQLLPMAQWPRPLGMLWGQQESMQSCWQMAAAAGKLRLARLVGKRRRSRAQVHEACLGGLEGILDVPCKPTPGQSAVSW